MQMEFVWRDEEALRLEIEGHTGFSIDLTVTDNTSSIMTFKGNPSRKAAQLRIHRMFLSADPTVLRALSTWLVRRKSNGSATIIDDFIKQNEHMIRAASGRKCNVSTRGARFDLQALFDEVNTDYFDGTVDAPITWGRMPKGKRRRSIRLGSYTPEDHLIRIHPSLDQRFVPEYFVRYVIYHEMLHAHLGVKESASGRRCIHTPEFNRMERAYPDYDRAIAWHDNPRHLGRLLRTRAA